MRSLTLKVCSICNKNFNNFLLNIRSDAPVSTARLIQDTVVRSGKLCSSITNTGLSFAEKYYYLYSDEHLSSGCQVFPGSKVNLRFPSKQQHELVAIHHHPQCRQLLHSQGGIPQHQNRNSLLLCGAGNEFTAKKFNSMSGPSLNVPSYVYSCWRPSKAFIYTVCKLKKTVRVLASESLLNHHCTVATKHIYHVELCAGWWTYGCGSLL